MLFNPFRALWELMARSKVKSLVRARALLFVGGFADLSGLLVVPVGTVGSC